MKIMFFLILYLTANLVFAARLVEGEVDGKIKFHGQKKFVAATFVVSSRQKDDALSYRIEMIHNDRLYKFEKLKFDGKQMVFVLDTGQKYECVMSFNGKAKNKVQACKDRDGYCGECIYLADDEKQKRIVINMMSVAEQGEPAVQDKTEVEDLSSEQLETEKTQEIILNR